MSIFGRYKITALEGARWWNRKGSIELREDGTGELRLGKRRAAIRAEVVPAPPGMPTLVDFAFDPMDGEGQAYQGRASASVSVGDERVVMQGRLFPRDAPHAAFTAERED